MDLTFIKQHKWVVALFGAAAGGFILYTYLHRGSGGTASPVVGGNALGQVGSPQYLVPVVQSDNNPGSTSTSPVSNVPVPAAPTTAGTTHTTSITQPNTSSAAVIAANPYTVGTKVTSSETITQSMYDPLYGAWVDLTSKGGIYTGPGLGVSGSAYNPAWTGSGRLALTQGGAAVQEYNAKGALVGTYRLGK